MGGVLGLLFILLVLAVDVLLVRALIVHSIRPQQINLITFLIGLVVIASLPVLVVAAYETLSWFSLRYHLDRNGIVVAEGGCMYLLERLSDARARGAQIYGEIVGYAMNSDAHDFVLPHPERQAECVRLALRRAGLQPENIDIVNTHATGTTTGDQQECQALKSIFDGHGHTPVSYTHLTLPTIYSV